MERHSLFLNIKQNLFCFEERQFQSNFPEALRDILFELVGSMKYAHPTHWNEGSKING